MSRRSSSGLKLVAGARPQGFLLLVRKGRCDVLRIVPRALEVTQKRQQDLEDAYLGSTVVSADGHSREIVGLEVRGFISSLPRWLAWLSVTGARELHLSFSAQRAITADELRQVLLSFLRSKARLDEWAQSQPMFDRLDASIVAASSVAEIFASIERCGPDVGGVDVLV
jgi:hypothetical protein